MPTPPVLALTSVTIGAPDPRQLAQFYARLLSTTVQDQEGPGPGEPDQAGWAQLKATHEDGSLTVNIEYEACWQKPQWPAQQGHPLATQHLDIHVDDLEAATHWAIQCGATPASAQPQESVRVLIDPAGHPFCFFTDKG